MNKNQEKLNSFIAYCKAHGEQRFFQCLRNWVQENIDAKWNFIYVSDGKESQDTFYWE